MSPRLATSQGRARRLAGRLAAAALLGCGACQSIVGVDVKELIPATTGQGGAGGSAGAGQAGAAGDGGQGGGGSGASGQGGGTTPPSCQGAPLLCGGESCCARLPVPAGAVQQGRAASGGDSCESNGIDPQTCEPDEQPEHEVTVPAFWLDRYEVTVGRFRAFLAAPKAPPEGGGSHPLVAGSGWRGAWEGETLSSGEKLRAKLLACAGHTYADDAASDPLPINCLDWFEAFAFCAWDGGRLPLEAEWERAAAGDGARVFPWGNAKATCERAQYVGCAPKQPAPAGGRLAGAGPFGHLDLAGNLAEFVLDIYGAGFYAAAPAGCAPCANADFAHEPLAPPPLQRVLRGGSFFESSAALRAAYRGKNIADASSQFGGLRCAYDAP